jgi:hypothetical protein
MASRGGSSAVDGRRRTTCPFRRESSSAAQLSLGNSSLSKKCSKDKVGEAGVDIVFASSALEQEQQLVYYDDWRPESIRIRCGVGGSARSGIRWTQPGSTN